MLAVQTFAARAVPRAQQDHGLALIPVDARPLRCLRVILAGVLAHRSLSERNRASSMILTTCTSGRWRSSALDLKCETEPG